MSSKFSFQSSQDFRPGTAELHARESSNLMMARHDMETRLASLREAQRDLLQQLRAAQSGSADLSRVSWLRTNIVQVNNHIESVSLELARLNHRLRKRNWIDRTLLGVMPQGDASRRPLPSRALYARPIINPWSPPRQFLPVSIPPPPPTIVIHPCQIARHEAGLVKAQGPGIDQLKHSMQVSHLYWHPFAKRDARVRE